MTKYMPFVYDDKEYVTNQKCFIITGKNVAYLTAFFNSSLFKYCFRDSFPELQGGTRELSKIFFDKIPVLEVSSTQNEMFRIAIEDIQKEYTQTKAMKIDNMFFDMYVITAKRFATLFKNETRFYQSKTKCELNSILRRGKRHLNVNSDAFFYFTHSNQTLRSRLH